MGDDVTRVQALDRAIQLAQTRSKATSADRLVKDAKKIEAFINGEDI